MKTVAYYGYIIEHVIEVLLENRIVSSVLLFSNFLDYDLKPLLVGIHTLNYSTTLTRSKICPVYNQCKIFTNYISTYDLLKNFKKEHNLLPSF